MNDGIGMGADKIKGAGLGLRMTLSLFVLTAGVCVIALTAICYVEVAVVRSNTGARKQPRTNRVFADKHL